MSDDLFDFEDLAMDVPAPGSIASSPVRLSDPVDQPRGTLFMSSPTYVASEVAGGAGK